MSVLSKSLRKLRYKLQPQLLASTPDNVASELASKFHAITRPGSDQVYSHLPPVNCRNLRFPLNENQHALQSSDASQSGWEQLRSCLCTRHQLDSTAFRFWAMRLHEEWRLHRKLWEHCFILQSLYERDMLRPGRRGLGFAVGEEQLPALMANLGCEIVASDLDLNDDRSVPWAQTTQFKGTLEALNIKRLCPEDEFQQRVDFRPVDMNLIPEDLTGFDFTWSSCSFEHCGSIGLGKRFIREQMKCLKPGGIAVHTTEFNLSSLEETVEAGDTVIFRRQDIESLIRDLKAEGHHVEPLQLDVGDSPEDATVDMVPYSEKVHLKLDWCTYTTTSVVLVIQKNKTNFEQAYHSSRAGENLRSVA